MCGICGGFGRKIESEKTFAMGEAIRHRGPDGKGYYETVTSFDATVILHSRRLAIVDAANGAQPMTDQNVHVVWNGEIYNHRELRITLEGMGYTFSTASDTEVILKMYQRYGADCVRYFQGMFAIAIYDDRAETLYLFRDACGIKPLFYTGSKERFLFGSEIKALRAYDAFGELSGGGAERMSGILAEAFGEYLQYHGQLAPATCFQGIFELEPAAMLTVSREGVAKKKYDVLSFAQSLPGTDIKALEYENPYDECDVIAELRSHIYKAVERRLVEGEPVGVLLSGGLDSSYIAALAAGISREPVYTHTLRFYCEADKGNAKDQDVEAAEYLAKKLGTFHTTYTVTGQEALESLERIVSAFDQPYSGGVSLYWLMERVPKQHRVFLSGDGADEAFWGYSFHSVVYDRLYREPQAGDKSRKQKLKMPGLPMEFWELLLSDEMKYMLEAYRRRDEDKGEGGSLEHLAELTNLHYYNKLLAGQVLRYVDTLSMAHGKEIRSPFMDRRVIDCAAELPVWMKMRDGQPKYLLKRAAAKVLPPEILNRRKETFLPPIALWMQKEWKELILDMLSYERLKGSGYFQPEQVLYMLGLFYGSPEENGYIAEIIWTILMFELWAESENL